jgi:predicted nucleic acid-binding protein
MKVLVDTSISFLALRKKKTQLNKTQILIVEELIELINESRVVLIGPVRQEILSGIVSKSQFQKLKAKFRAFEDFPINQRDYELAAEFYNICRKNGVKGSHIDFLICSTSYNHKFSIFTTDKDFENYSKHLNISIHSVRKK